MLRITLLLSIFLLALIDCASGPSSGDQKTLTLNGTSITYHVPEGFVPADEDDVITYPRRPMRYFYLPELPSGGQPAYPEIYIEQMAPSDSSMPPQNYVTKVTSNAQSTLEVAPHDISIDGRNAIEFAVKNTTIYDFAGGKSATGEVVDYEIVFQDGGVLYHCAMESGADDYKPYLSIFESFCSSVHFNK